MSIQPEHLLLVGCATMTLALLEAWCLSGIRHLQLEVMRRIFPSYPYLLKSHIDFLLMTGLLFVFYLVLAHLDVVPPGFVLLAMGIGSFVNPTGFLALAIKPDLPQTHFSVFGAIMAGSFVLTTVGYLGAAWLIARAVLARL
jgi:hypothetical protein